MLDKIQLEFVFGINLTNSKYDEVDTKLEKQIKTFYKSRAFIRLLDDSTDFIMLENLFLDDKFINKTEKKIYLPEYVLQFKNGDVKKVIINKQKKQTTVIIVTKLMKNKEGGKKFHPYCPIKTSEKTCPDIIYNNYKYTLMKKYPMKKLINIVIDAIKHSFYAGGVTYQTGYYKKMNNIDLLPIIKVKSKLNLSKFHKNQ